MANDKRYAREHIEITKYDEDPENTGLEDSAKRLQDAAEPLQFRGESKESELRGVNRLSEKQRSKEAGEREAG